MSSELAVCRMLAVCKANEEKEIDMSWPQINAYFKK
jgi:hypothetical protein